MELRTLIGVRPVCFFILLASIALVLPSLVVSLWVIKFKGIEKELKLISQNVRHQVLSDFEKRAELLSPMNSSATKLARVLNSSLDGVNISFSTIENYVAPILFEALSTIPHSSHISYTGLDNLSFSYYFKDNQLLAVYSNSTQFLNMSFTQPANPDNGKLYGEATRLFSPSGWENDRDFLFIQTADVGGNGFLSLGFPVKLLTNFFAGVEFYGGYLYLATKDGKMIMEGIPNTRLLLLGNFVTLELLNSNGTHEGYVGNLTCKADDALRGSMVNIWGRNYMVYCSTLDVTRVQSVYALALPQKDDLDHKNMELALMLLILVVAVMFICIFTSIFIILKAARREMYLCAALIKQMETTQQAERKCLNKSLALASASHDVRASLAGISGLIDMCHQEVHPGTELHTNFNQMEACTKDLLGILNSILDTSKLEAGKMQLEDVEFDLAQLLEDVVDLYYPVGMGKGVDVILDPCDGSIFSQYSKVKGDRTKLKQVLSNLLSNAVKFTHEGHVAVRGWAKKPGLKTSIFSSSQKSSSLGCISSLLFKKKGEAHNGHSESMNMVQENSNFLEFVFEVDDSGIGIPKEKQNSVFENYVQVKETALAQEGTGLGLGIVQSLVRLMGGEIRIMDKDIGEKGTCFRFNIFLTTTETGQENEITRESSIESQGEYSSHDSVHFSGPSTRAFGPKQEHSHVALFIEGEARRRISRKFMERMEIRVSIINEWRQLPHTLKKIKKKLILSKYSSSSISDASSRGEIKSVPLSTLDGTDEIPTHSHRRTNPKSIPNFVLVVIDTSGGPFRELSRAVVDFRRDLHNTCCRIVWIDKPGARNMIHSKGLDESKLPFTDLIISKPFHGSRLYRVIELLPEFGGTIPGQERIKNTSQSPNVPSDSQVLENNEDQIRLRSKGKEILGSNILSKEEILSGKKILVVEDNVVLRRLAISNITRLGAIAESCGNGEEALQLVSRGLSDRRKHSSTTSSFPYDYILMDCEMPVMDGFEATKRIREEEEYYGVHVPIIALTAHITGEGADKMIQSGVDFFLAKPLKREELIEAILYIDNNSNQTQG